MGFMLRPKIKCQKTISSKEALEILNSLNKKTQAKMATEKPKKQQKKSKIKTKK